MEVLIIDYKELEKDISFLSEVIFDLRTIQSEYFNNNAINEVVCTVKTILNDTVLRLKEFRKSCTHDWEGSGHGKDFFYCKKCGEKKTL